MHEVLSNTSPLVYLHQIGRMDLLPALYGRIVIPEAVAFELSEGARLGHAVPAVEALPWITVEKVEKAALLQLVTDLDAGEREALALAVGRPGCVLLLDDGHARRYATMLGLTFTGTLGVLLRAKKRGLLQEGATGAGSAPGARVPCHSGGARDRAQARGRGVIISSSS